jgi:hypothetical protein
MDLESYGFLLYLTKIILLINGLKGKVVLLDDDRKSLPSIIL